MIDVVQGSGSDVAGIMPVMDSAFDPAFGEAWTAAQCLSTLAMPDSVLFCAQPLGYRRGRIVADRSVAWRAS
jgi:ribosomal-protein-alanine N-acetyltransferase